MSNWPRPTLGQAFILTIAGLAALLGVLFSLFVDGSRRSIIRSSDALREAKSDLIGGRVESYLDGARASIEHIENQIRYGACRAGDVLSVETSLFAEVLNNPDVAEVALTHALAEGYDAEGRIRLAPRERWQVSVFRQSSAAASAIHTRFTLLEGERWISELRTRAPGGGLLEGPVVVSREAAVPAPTEDATFTTPASRAFQGQTLWSDLSYAELDARLPEAQRRVVVTVLKAVEDRSGAFVGVVRVGILERQLDELVTTRGDDPHRVFISDAEGRLITRVTTGDRLQDLAGDLRVVADRLPPEIARALSYPGLRQVGPGADRRMASGRFVEGERGFLVSFRYLANTQGWRVGIVVPEDQLPGIGKLIETRDRLLRWSVVVILVILGGGILTLRTVQSGLKKVIDQAARMRDFDFAPSELRVPFRDVADVLASVELAKTAMRAMGKYVPVDLVRDLYKTRREPVLGGEPVVVSLMFTDIKDFTAYSERLPPNELAASLGGYLEVMTAAIHATHGTIDKYIGDAVMALWNAPRPLADHERQACRAALACVEATRRLYASPAWRGRPAFETRFGLHRAEVLVGHFGAPDRMSFTALGDGVNLASRLEGLNKQYGTTILASEAIRERAGDAFAFRVLDVVAVKGKSQGVRVYELLAEAGAPEPRLAAARRYEQAFAAYLARRFADALAIAESNGADFPSAVLAARCRELQAHPPPPDWNGVHVWLIK